ncbi:MAG TPA: hypothetical protein VEI02_15805 [Planctomycetota bacterium]|nr:hypothetical protein [Planctomycetota bacterium]
MIRIAAVLGVACAFALEVASPRGAASSVEPVARDMESGVATKAPATASPPDQDRIDAAIADGLAWLARAQAPCGGWTADVGHKQADSYVVRFDAARARAEGRAHPGVSGFAGMAFLAAGHVPGRGPYAATLERAIDYLCSGDPSEAYISDSESDMYGHAFAVLFLAQVDGMARGRDARVAARLRSAARMIEHAQNAVGGWRYYPYADEADLSVSVCQMQALRSAKEAGVRVSAETARRMIRYLEDSRIPDGRRDAGCFYYKITGRAARTRTSFAVNAAAVASLHSAGVYDAKRYGRALDYVERHYREVSSEYAEHFYFWYGNWHAVQAFRMEGGARFREYFARVSADLLARRRDDGRWVNAVGPGDAWSTAIACLILSAPYGYLPLFAN